MRTVTVCLLLALVPATATAQDGPDARSVRFAGEGLLVSGGAGFAVVAQPRA